MFVVICKVLVLTRKYSQAKTDVREPLKDSEDWPRRCQPAAFHTGWRSQLGRSEMTEVIPKC